ncbi:hypothetical protein GOP47_0023267 [Adiantum capillus-veneris]|uniref:Uncharacterized protein n=1 Tax=Adiantum capillus-veneris TaxID=13818 RepID=A0A9D4U763_ADICA|nr:hypothetical protein GOP47_0023267 [Adiantum capillus-veneris]
MVNRDALIGRARMSVLSVTKEGSSMTDCVLWISFTPMRWCLHSSSTMWGSLQRPVSRSIVNFGQLWVDWGERKGTVGKADCQNTWCTIAKGWESFIEKASWKSFLKKCRIPCEPLAESGDGSDALSLARPSEVLYGDNLILAETFHQAFPSLKFAWYPRCADATPWVDKKCYSDLGVKRLSDVLVGEPAVNTSRSNVLPDLCRKGSIGRGLYRAILGYLADPKHLLSAEARKRMILQLRSVACG